MFEHRLRLFLGILLCVMGVLLMRAFHLQVITKGKWQRDAEDFNKRAIYTETTRGRIRGMLRKIDALAELSASEAELVMFALDERLRLAGLDPVFAAEEGDEEPEAVVTAPPAGKVGRNDPCPCGSGKKYKKCHGV